MTMDLQTNTPIWDRSGWAPLPPLEGDVSADVCVVGLGGSGLACILELLRFGKRVVGIDARRVAGGAAGRNGGFLLAGLPAFYHDAIAALGHARARRLYASTVEEIDRMTLETPEAIRRVGSLRIAASSDEEQDCAMHLEALLADGFAAEAYHGPEGKGLLIPGDGAFDPVRRCRALAGRAIEQGARLFEASPAIDVATGSVATPRGRVRCDDVVVAVDGRLERIFPVLAGRVRTARLQMLATAPTREVWLPRPVYARWGYDYWQQLEDDAIALGGCRDRALEEEWTELATPTAGVQSLLERLLRDHLGVEAPIVRRWAASVSYTDDGLPVLEEMAPGIIALGGYSGTGNVLGALCGRAAAALAVGGRPDLISLLRAPVHAPALRHP